MDIYYYDINALCGPEQEAKAAERLLHAGWEERLSAASRFRMEADRKRCLCAGLALLDALEERNIRPSMVLKTPDGKPYLEKTQGFHFNLSHSGNYAVCAVSDREIGIDIQEVRKPQEALVKFCCTEQEQKRILESAFSSEAFTLVWAWKEAFMKMTGRGLRIPPEKIEVLLSPGAEAGLSGTDFSGNSFGPGGLFGKLSLRKSSTAIRPAGQAYGTAGRFPGSEGQEPDPAFGPMILYEGTLGGMPVCVCESGPETDKLQRQS